MKILILDYSVSRMETPAIKKWLPEDAIVTSFFIDTEEFFPKDLLERDFTHVIHSGSELSITKTSPFTNKAISYIKIFRDKGIAQFGICYGHQLISRALVGKQSVRSSPNGVEAGWDPVSFNDHAMKLFGIRESEVVWQYHFDEVIEMPEGSKLLATSPHTKIQAYVNYEQNLLGTQFHPEFDKETGDKLFLDDREQLERNNYNVDEMVTKGPSFDTGNIFFDYFLK
ncbi:MAG: C26 family cysteine hydrolase domain-containing family [Candidatus Marinimicrobia bacterium]|nr:C26 family cysteine hydrolase domain-containing family [Candidatus Neomarinimicrobiota bacterium]MBT3683622.1 C26 family cysteine hydrolase domain-containing family [Candidatus Neomarinimicrobiota bacterium]MBT3760401.1 C26 family cysteine hydrolase domain-containing family [Candidatus Neomarinimicrobiota bacterium]MBT3896521.1 C26 family cysteine hydrolase domain-containing family [Candidatus Neomarinimicrobiota bacterium]MBT4173565.1 C26 family cysteine hydrolase domain-containing family [